MVEVSIIAATRRSSLSTFSFATPSTEIARVPPSGSRCLLPARSKPTIRHPEPNKADRLVGRLPRLAHASPTSMPSSVSTLSAIRNASTPAGAPQ